MNKKAETSKKLSELDLFYKEFSKEEDMDKYAGEWIAVKEGKVLSAGRSFKKVLHIAESKARKPLMIKIANKNEVLVL